MTKDVLWVQFDALSPLRQNWPREDEDKDDMWAAWQWFYPISIQAVPLCPRALPLPLLKLSLTSNYDNGDRDDALEVIKT